MNFCTVTFLSNNIYASTDKPLAEWIEPAHWGQSPLCKSQLWQDNVSMLMYMYSR